METLELPKKKGYLLLVRLFGKTHPKYKLEDLIDTNLFKVIGRFSQLSDKTFDDFIEPMYINAGTDKGQRFGFMNYINVTNKYRLCCSNSKESFRSLMISQNVFIDKDFLILEIKGKR